MAEEDGNIFKKLTNKFRLAAKKDLNDLPDEIREQCQEVDNYRDALRELYMDLMRLLNGHPDYDPAERIRDPYYLSNESPGEKLNLAVYPMRETLWDIKFVSYCMRLGMELTEIEKIVQRDARAQLFHMREFLFKEFPKFEKLRSELVKSKNKMDNAEEKERKKAKATEEYNSRLVSVREFITKQVPKAKKHHVLCLLYFMRCIRQFHMAMGRRYSGIATIKVPRPGQANQPTQ